LTNFQVVDLKAFFRENRQKMHEKDEYPNARSRHLISLSKLSHITPNVQPVIAELGKEGSGELVCF